MTSHERADLGRPGMLTYDAFGRRQKKTVAATMTRSLSTRPTSYGSHHLITTVPLPETWLNRWCSPDLAER